MLERRGWVLIIEIENRKVRKIFKDDTTLIKTIGLDMARSVKKRLNQLIASDNFMEFLEIGLGNPHPLVCNLDKCYGIKITGNYRLIVKPLSENLDADSLRKCKKIDLKGVADYHGEKCEWLIP